MNIIIKYIGFSFLFAFFSCGEDKHVRVYKINQPIYKIYEYVEGNYVEKSLLEDTELGKAYWFKIDEDYIFNFEF